MKIEYIVIFIMSVIIGLVLFSEKDSVYQKNVTNWAQEDKLYYEQLLQNDFSKEQAAIITASRKKTSGCFIGAIR